MVLLSPHLPAPAKALLPSNPPSSVPFRNPLLFTSSSSLNPLLNHPPWSLAAVSSSSFSSSSYSSAAAGVRPVEKNAGASLPAWGEFARRVSGEWDGFGADFTAAGEPVELPESAVPGAYREWAVQVFDWQTQCPTLADETGEAGGPPFFYKEIRLLPTVGCEADAATRYSVEERVVGGAGNKASAFGFDQSGSYVAVWPLEGRRSGDGALELEHCLVDPGDWQVRVRVVQVVRKEEEERMRLAGIRVFSEQWYGPFRNGEQLGGCAIREAGFASTAAVKESEVVGAWQGTSLAVARFQAEQTDLICGLVVDAPQKSIRDRTGLVALPKQLWCSFKEKEDGKTWAEVGWLLSHGIAVTSKCVFHEDGRLKEMAIGRETAVDMWSLLDSEGNKERNTIGVEKR